MLKCQCMIVSGEELEQLKTGGGGLFRLVQAYSHLQAALANAQPARQLLDDVLNEIGRSIRLTIRYKKLCCKMFPTA